VWPVEPDSQRLVHFIPAPVRPLAAEKLTVGRVVYHPRTDGNEASVLRMRVCIDPDGNPAPCETWRTGRQWYGSDTPVYGSFSDALAVLVDLAKGWGT
jgi:hypothetical protein